MRRIYGTTSQNLVWLGPYDDTIAESINAMEVMLQEVAIEARDYADFGKFSFENDRFQRFSKDRLSNTVDCLALLRLLDNPWFTRLWIVQGASLAPSSMCHYGKFKVPLDKVLRLAAWLHHKWYRIPEIPQSIAPRLNNAASLFSLTDKEHGVFHTTVGDSAMVNLLRQYGLMQTFDRRDRVFVILGLWQMLTKAPVLPNILRPNYDSSVCEVFKISTRYAIDESNHL